MAQTDNIPAAVKDYWASHPDSIWLYDAKFPLAIVAAVLYAIPMVYIFFQTCFKYKSYYFIVVFFGALLECAGYVIRGISIKSYKSIPPYATSSTFIVVAPLFVGAGSYLLITRLCLRVLPPSPNRKIFHIPILKLTRIFVSFDILTLLIQASGSAIAASNNWEGDTVKIGENVLIGGLALQLKRSWKGPKSAPISRRSARLSPFEGPSREVKSGSNTPTQEAPKVYATWPHSSSTTRSHLRDMCKRKSTAVTIHRHLQSRSPTPFTKDLHARLRTPEPSSSTLFNTKDIALSLTTSTAESMQPDGPLAKLSHEPMVTPITTSKFPSFENIRPSSLESPSHHIGAEEVSNIRRLGSPFGGSRTYGPSSSRQPRPVTPRTQSDTVSGPYLRSPLRFNRSLNNTQKRRAAHDLEEELSPSGAVLRPSILDEQLFGTPFNQRRVRSRGFSLGDEALSHRTPSVFQGTAFADLPCSNSSIFESATRAAPKAPALSPPPSFDTQPPRLGSPFSESGPSNTFPRRLLQDGTATIRRTAFATMHQTRRSIESFDFGDGPSLQSRLGQLDMKLKEIRDREAAARRASQE